jgi:3-isopropylmalate dehydratase small subunit
VAESFGAIYERNAINAAFPIITAQGLDSLGLEQGDEITIHFEKGEIINHSNQKTLPCTPFSEVQMEIYQNNGLF